MENFKVYSDRKVYYNQEGTKYHRTDGPAVEYYDGDVEYYIDGIRLTEREFISKQRLIKVKKIINIR